MQFVLMIYQGTTPLPGSDAWDALSEPDQQTIYAEYGALTQDPAITGGPPLGLPVDATTVRVVDGAPTTEVGPYLSRAQAVGGFLVVEADDLASAVDIAARIRAARLGGAVEVRPVATYW